MKCLAERKRHNKTGLLTLWKLTVRQHVYMFLFYFLSIPQEPLLWIFLYSKVHLSSFGPYLALPGWNMPLVCTAPPKWWKSILTRDQELYDEQSLPLEAHQYHLNGRQKPKKKICPLCAFPAMPLKICSYFLQSATQFFIEVPLFGQGNRQGDVLTWRCVQDGNGPPFFYFLPLASLTRKKSKNWWLAWSNLLVREGFFILFFLASGTIVRNQSKGKVIVESGVY